MATIKSYTDIEQSKKLAEILPLESANMYYHKNTKDEIVEYPHFNAEYKSMVDRDINYNDDVLPCWSLAALIEVLPSIEGFKPVIDLDINQIRYEGKYRDELCFNENNLINACYKMILNLNELKML